MALYLISYDLRNHATMNQYEELIKELRRLGAQKAQLSEWLWKSENTPAQIRDHLRKFIHDSDRLLITAVGGWASWNSMIDVNKV
jgi:hypothetical protein